MIKYVVEICHDWNNNRGEKIEKEFTPLQWQSVNCFDYDVKSNKQLFNYACKLIDRWNTQAKGNFKYSLIIDV